MKNSFWASIVFGHFFLKSAKNSFTSFRTPVTSSNTTPIFTWELATQRVGVAHEYTLTGIPA